MLLAIDPGADSGWARFGDDGALVACGLNDGAMDAGITRIYIERPMIYPGGRQQARPRDIITLALRAGDWAGWLRGFVGVQAEYVEPAEWKGQVRKDIHHARIWARLSPAEQAIAADAAKGIAPSKRHNMLDAIGIGLHAIGRKA